MHHRHRLRIALESSTVLLLVSACLGDVTQLTTLSASLPGVYAQATIRATTRPKRIRSRSSTWIKTGVRITILLTFLRALQKPRGPEPGHAFQYLASHPPTTDRIHRFEKYRFLGEKPRFLEENSGLRAGALARRARSCEGGRHV